MLKKVIFYFIPFLVLFALLETGFRIYDLFMQKDPEEEETGIHEYLQQAHVPDRSFPYRKKDFSVIVSQNSVGAHDVEHSYRKEREKKRILIIGDSFVEAHQVDLKETFFRKLEQFLNQESEREEYEVISLGMSGYGPEKEYHLLRNLGLKYHPDLVILFFLDENDIRDVSKRLSGDVRVWTEFQNRLSKIEEENRYSILFSRYSRFLQWMGTLLGKLTVRHIYLVNKDIKGEETIPPDTFVFLKESSPEWEEAWQEAFFFLLCMDEICRANGARFSLVSVGTRFNIYPDVMKAVFRQYPYMKEMSWDFFSTEKKVKHFCREQGIPYFSVGKVMAEVNKKGREEFFFDGDGHWNKEGHHLVAGEVARWIQEEHLIEEDSVKETSRKEKKIFQENILDMPLSFNDRIDAIDETKRFIYLPACEKERGMQLLWKVFVATPPVELEKGRYQITLEAKGVPAREGFPRLQIYLLSYPFPVKKGERHVIFQEDPYLFHYNFLKHSSLYSQNWSYLLFMEKAKPGAVLKEGLWLLEITPGREFLDFTSPAFIVGEKGDFSLCLFFSDDGRAFYSDGVIEDRAVFLKHFYIQSIDE
ncbi:MAG: SGNH/GDSL hydrolase family protein [Candidatus Aureabacteria bacterium]|nr:SGNH/GDSL hydrolase family protein [Candidatus Auribacterota bacterium]